MSVNNCKTRKTTILPITYYLLPIPAQIMSLNPDIRDQAYQFFIEEAQELLQVLETGLLDLRENHSTPKVHELMRAAHSIKGGAASVELAAIELLAHRLEDFFKALYSDRVDFDGELESLLLQGYDCLRNPLTEQIKAGTFDEEAALLKAKPVFAALEIRLADALKNADNYIPSSNDLGIDIVSSVFEVDVVQALEHLQEVAANPANYNLGEEFQGQLDMFAGFAELFNLSGFSDIVQTSQTALAQNPDRILDIIQATVADCTLAKERVLAGDREQGGEVSSTLKELAQASSEESVFSNFESTMALEELVIEDRDSLWSSEPILDPLADNIFGTIPDEESVLEEIAEATELAEESIDDIFGTIPNNKPVEEAAAEIIESSNADINDLFAAIPDEESVLEEFTEATELAEESISDIFGIIPNNKPVEEAVGEIIESVNADIDDIFGTIADEQPLEEIAEDLVAQNNSSPAENIETAVESIEQLFASLPSVESQPSSLSLPTKSTSTQELKPVESEAAQPQIQAAPKLSVRVELDRLEKMNNLVGELTINRNSLSLQNQQLQENVSELGQKFSRFREVTKKLREIADQIILEQRSNSLRSSVTQISTSNQSAYATEFDSLEMDSYSTLYSSLQEVLEEVVQLEESVDDITIFAKQSDRTINNQRQMLGQMRDELMWVRMLPLEQILQRFPRILRDLSSKYHKPVDLKMNGTGVLVDKAVLEKLADPLLHLLRNGFDHGIEQPDVRAAEGKPARGSIEIQAYYQGNQTVIEVKDDGKGLDLEKIKHKGIEQGLISATEAATATKERLFDLIFEPGFSTASKVSELSGRGVGMNIVRSQIETLKGKITVASIPGQGSTFTLRLPLTLTIAKLLVCSLGTTAFAIPSDSIEEIIVPTNEQIKVSNQQKFLSFNTKLIPVYSLAAVLQYNCPIPNTDSNSKAFKTITPPEDWLAPLLLLRRGQELVALEVVSLLNEQELVIKPYGKAIAAPAYTYGCTILGDGSLIPAFDGAALISMILGEEITSVASTPTFIPEADLASESIESIVTEEITANDNLVKQAVVRHQTTSLKTIMIIDDSTALRRTMALTLEKQGYRVVQKKDGKDGLDGFRQNPDLDLIICDVEMPTMNGFEFLGMRRRDSDLSKIPTFMLTSRSGAKHRNLAMQLGANGYFTKPYVEQEFIAEIKKILEDKKYTGSPATFATKTETILVIDDSSALRRTLALSLERRGYRVLQGRDGLEGLELLRNNLQTNLVICDVEMPNMNGFEFLTTCREESQLTDIPVVMLSSRSSDKHQSLTTSLGAKHYFTKPYIEDKFLSEIDKIIKQLTTNN